MPHLNGKTRPQIKIELFSNSSLTHEFVELSDPKPMITTDLHVHSTYSDGKLSIAELVDLYGERGFGCIAITDHICEERTFLGKAANALRLTLTKESFPSYLETIREQAERAWDQYRMLVLPGFEISKNSIFHRRSAHILGIGVSQWIDAEDSIESVCRQMSAQGALSIAAHPVHTGKWEPQTFQLWDRREEFWDTFDAWEVASGRIFFDEVYQSGVKMLATSDLHHPKQIHSWKTLLQVRRGERDPEAVLSAVREQRLEFEFWREPHAAINSGVATI